MLNALVDKSFQNKSNGICIHTRAFKCVLNINSKYEGHHKVIIFCGGNLEYVDLPYTVYSNMTFRHSVMLVEACPPPLLCTTTRYLEN